jgi:hypothetical protein
VGPTCQDATSSGSLFPLLSLPPLSLSHTHLPGQASRRRCGSGDAAAATREKRREVAAEARGRSKTTSSSTTASGVGQQRGRAAACEASEAAAGGEGRRGGVAPSPVPQRHRVAPSLASHVTCCRCRSAHSPPPPPSSSALAVRRAQLLPRRSRPPHSTQLSLVARGKVRRERKRGGEERGSRG